jgi:hypothetical protein
MEVDYIRVYQDPKRKNIGCECVRSFYVWHTTYRLLEDSLKSRNPV